MATTNTNSNSGYPNQTEVAILIKQSFASANASCTAPWVLDYAQPISSSTTLTFHNILSILSGAACIIILLITLYLITGHVRNWTNPAEQKQYVRIILFTPAFALCAALSILFYHADGYIAPWGQWYEGFAMCALFLLFIEVVDQSQRATGQVGDRMHSSGSTETSPASFEKEPGHINASPVWDKRLAMNVFQVMLTRPVTCIAQLALYGLTCPLSPTRSKGALAISVVQAASTTFAVIGCVRLERKHKRTLAATKGLWKLVTFKCVVGLQFIQQIVFNILAEQSIFFPEPPYLVSWNDFDKGLPQLILAWECVIVAVLFLWTFGFGEFRRAYNQGARKGGVGRALVSVININDIVKGTIAAFTGGKGYEPAEQHERVGVLHAVDETAYRGGPAAGGEGYAVRAS